MGPAGMSEAGPVALVTGASRGIGRAIAVGLAEAGCRVAVGFASSDELAGKAAAEIGGLAVHLDVTDQGSIEAAFATIETQWGPVEVLVNNAGITDDGLAVRMPPDQWRRVLATNLDGAFLVSQRAIPSMMRARGGRIVNVGSAAGLTGSAGQVNYSAAKAGLVGLTRSLARELGTRGITVNVVAPGPIDTDMTAALTEDQRATLVASVPLRRMGRAEEVAAAVIYLCSPAAAYVTGTVLGVDGGLGMGH
jgi:3-oxoacyl-[acyl-carrier protein] reductase